MLIYLAHANANFASELDGYVMGMRVAEHEKVLQAFEFLQGRIELPITKKEEKPCTST